jgi:hypothetical protein
MSNILELYGFSTRLIEKPDWKTIATAQSCPYLNRKCLKIRKSDPRQTIGTCSVLYGKKSSPQIICPYRLLERRQIFADCIHLLTAHEPGNQLHIVSEVTVPGGSVDYFLVSTRNKKVRDFVGIELQALDTTGTVWPERQRFLRRYGIRVRTRDLSNEKGYGMNWKMTAKTVLVQLHHKVQTFEGINKHLALIIQDSFLEYMRKEFKLNHLNNALIGDPMHIHAYRFAQTDYGAFQLELATRISTDSNGIAKSLGLQVSPKIELEEIVKLLEAKISDATLFYPLEAS